VLLNSGDDSVSNNSHVGDPGSVHDITVGGNTILNNAWGRGLEVSGGSSITFSAASASQSGNQVLAPSAYSTPMVPSGGGCNFNGC
jgi:hypothetical protein